MSTRSLIGIKRSGDYVDYIYCHFDGYPKHNGEILKDYYYDEEKINELISLGDISSLGIRVNPIGEHSFRYPEEGTTVAYHRDRGENLANKEPVKKGEYISRLFAEDYGAEYIYLYEDGKWNCLKVYED